MLLEKITPLTRGQKEIVKALKNPDYEIIGIFGPTGTGKSLFSLAYGIDAVSSDYKRFIVVKPVIDVVTGEELTLADGEKFLELAKAYVLDVIGQFVDWSEVERLISDGKIVFVDPHYLKGRTFDDSVVFLDEIQTLKPESVVEILIRMGRNSRLIVAGDPIFQSFKMEETQDPASMVRDILTGEENAKVVDLGIKDIVREGAKRGLRLLIEYRMRSRELSEVEKEIFESAKVHSPDADVITVVEFCEEKERFEITSEHTPDALIIVKQGHYGRLVGRGGERIKAIEEDVGKRIRGVELTLDFRELIRSIHPVSWIWKHIRDVDFVGQYLTVEVKGEIGAFVGQRGLHVRFLDAVIRKLMGVGVRAVEV
ncbi:PhoH family protein [Archaeoglobus profundus]|uniref:PhoH family protein n=1 Tax=Archaeoglobus profundus (strain DSM 5631 / JCM 9629 / NBRC 100127 / Av18) TaxID=572546 RepID=D2RFL0_ARCPA|nr:PhoH family protein [Archaeoglobus profundus]ADB57085.1 PhoH family protein [Archaeoglobus profundus DSM 5631]